MFVSRSNSVPDLTVPAFKTSTLVAEGRTLLKNGRTEDALRFFEEALQQVEYSLHGQNEEARLGCMEALYTLQRDQEAHEHLRQLCLHHPGSTWYHREAARILEQLGRHESAEAALQTARAAVPRDAELLCDLGLFLSRRQRTDEALQCIRDALKEMPDSPRLLHILGLLQAGQGDLGAAIQSLIAADQRCPPSARLRSDLGIALFKAGRHGTAANVLIQSLALRPFDALTLRFYGQALIRCGKPLDALPPLSQALELVPQDPTPLLARSTAWCHLGKYAESLADCDRYLQQKPDSISGLRNRGWVYLLSGEHPKALADYEKIVKKEPDDATHWLGLGHIQFKAGKKEEAIASLKRAKSLNPKDPQIEDLARAITGRPPRKREGFCDHDLSTAPQAQAPGVEVMPMTLECRSNEARLGLEGPEPAGQGQLVTGNQEQATARLKRARNLNPADLERGLPPSKRARSSDHELPALARPVVRTSAPPAHWVPV